MTDKTQTKAVSNAPLTDGEFAEKYNRGHKIIDFVGHKKILFRLKQQRTESLLHMLRILWVTAAQR